MCSAEQQVSSLEAALQKGSQVTLSMTEKVAQTLAASNTQVDALKVGRSRSLEACGHHSSKGISMTQDALIPIPSRACGCRLQILGVEGGQHNSNLVNNAFQCVVCAGATS